ncbi:MAG TPA: hypothetical protein VGO47_01205 [Chlamydiales bacterium]|nr:hypothetical protein [Chlamydiales bacterium]
MSRNWGLTCSELHNLPPALARSFFRNKTGSFGADMGGDWGKLLMRGEKNAELYGPLQTLYEEGKKKKTDVWIHKNRYVKLNYCCFFSCSNCLCFSFLWKSMSGLWGPGTALDIYLKEEGLKTLFFSGVNTDQVSRPKDSLLFLVIYFDMFCFQKISVRLGHNDRCVLYGI